MRSKSVLIVLYFPLIEKSSSQSSLKSSQYSKDLNMISKILPVAALAGAAMAASSCPLSVEIAGVTDHVAQVAITNTGAEAVTVFKGNTVLSDHATLDLLASAGMMILRC